MRPILVFIHGFPNNGRMWQGQADHFAGRAQIEVAEWTGGTSPTLFADGVTHLIARIETLKTANPSRPVYLVGHDLGCFVAGEVSRLAPHLVQGQLFFNGVSIEQFSLRGRSVSQWLRSSYVAALNLPFLPRLLDVPCLQTFVGNLFYRLGGVGSGSALRMETQRDFRAIRVYREITRRVFAYAGRPRPRHAPGTIVIDGTNDPFLISPSREELGAVYENGKSVSLVGGHWLPVTHSQAVNEVIDRHINWAVA